MAKERSRVKMNNKFLSLFCRLYACVTLFEEFFSVAEGRVQLRSLELCRTKKFLPFEQIS